MVLESFYRINRNRMKLSTGKILEENLLHNRHWVRNSPFNRTTYNTRPNLYWSCLPRRQWMFLSYSFDLNLLENLLQVL